MYAAKFRYDLVVDLSPDQLYEKAKEAKEAYFHKMFGIADNLWANITNTGETKGYSRDGATRTG